MPITDERRAEWKRQINYCYEHEDKLETWESDILLSCYKRMNFNRDLSFKQSTQLRKMFNRIGE
jgi:hypothetical protein